MDLEYVNQINEYVNKINELFKKIPYKYRPTIKTYGKDYNNSMMKDYINNDLQNYYDKLKEYNIRFMVLDSKYGVVYFQIFNQHNIYKTFSFHISTNQIYLGDSSGGYFTRQYINMDSNSNIYKLGKREQNGLNLFLNSDNLLSNVLDFVNSIDINKLLQTINKIHTEFDYYPLQLVKEACRCLIAIRYFRVSSLSVLPKDIVKIIANELWKTRKDVKTWITLDDIK